MGIVDVKASMSGVLFYRKGKTVYQHFIPKLKKQFIKLKIGRKIEVVYLNVISWFP